MKQNRLLEILNHPIPEKVDNYALNSYSMILEAWRRGLKVSLSMLNTPSGTVEYKYSINDEKKIHYFSGTCGDLVSNQVKELLQNKLLANELLINGNVPAVKGKAFDTSSDESEILQYAADIAYPILLKPLAETNANVVISKIQNENELLEALNSFYNKIGSHYILIEKYVEGDNYQLYVLDGKIIGALKRIHSNEDAEENFIEVTGDLTENIKQIATNAVNTFNDLSQCSVSIMVDEEKDTGVITSLNANADIISYLAPKKGHSLDIPSALIDFYFPETVDYNKENAKQFYLDFDFLYDTYLDRSASEITLPVLPKKALKLTRYIISGCNYTKSFAKHVKFLAYQNNVNGYIKPFNNGNISIIVGSSQKKIREFRESLEKYLKEISDSQKIVEKKRLSPIMHGFHILSKDKKETANQNENLQISPEDKNALEKYINDYTKLKADYQKAIKRIAKYEQNENILEVTQRQNENLKKKLKQMEENNF